jgi:signal transduction histidine kinase
VIDNTTCTGGEEPGGDLRRLDLRALRCRQISHDIHHQLGMISLLATLLSTAADVGPDGRARARLIMSEIRWLDQLQQAYEECACEPDETAGSGPPERIRLDVVATELVDAVRLASTTRLCLYAEPLTAYTDRLAFRRALRNLLHNAVQAAGAAGTVEVRISAEDGSATIRVDDDGPGFEAVPSRPGSLGLGIVRDLATAWGGGVEIVPSGLGGGSVRLRMPIMSPTGAQNGDRNGAQTAERQNGDRNGERRPDGPVA